MSGGILSSVTSWWRSQSQPVAAGSKGKGRSVPRPKGSVRADGKPESPPGAGATPGAPAAPLVKTLERRLRDTLYAARMALREEFADVQGNADAKAIIELIGDEERAVVRQPPLAAQALLTLRSRRHYSMREVTHVIERDPSLSQALLRQANSAWYASTFGAPVISIRGAVQRIGAKGVHATVMSQLVKGQLCRPGAGFDSMASMVWEHMVRTAPVARQLGPIFSVDPESAYTLGLLHDVGKLVFFDRIAALRRKVRRDVEFPAKFISRALRELHEALGGLAALEWGLDESSALVIATHHRRPHPEPANPMCEVIYLAERFDVSHPRPGAVDIDGIWEEGGLTGPKERIQELLEAQEAEAEAEDAVDDAVQDTEHAQAV